MRFKPIIMIVLAVVFGGSAIVAGNSWLKRQAAQQRPQVVVQQEVSTTTIVVAAKPLRYGDELTALKLRQIPWPESALPPGAFRTVDELTQAGKTRIVLAPLEPNEPVLAGKVTGDGQRGTLSALLEDGMGAVTIQVDEVIGLAGFVLPGDRVDVFSTQSRSSDGGEREEPFNQRILQNVRVLAVGQTADERTDKPSIVRAITIEVDPVGAQKVALAARLGSLSLMLRKAGETASRPGRRLAVSEIGDSAATDSNAGAVSVRVTRGTARTTYAVPQSGIVGVDTSPIAVGSVKSAPGASRVLNRTEAAAEPPRP
jgi:pilus assembly protein CpaB